MSNSNHRPLYEANIFLKEVKHAFRYERHIYRDFLLLFKDYKYQRIDLETFKARVAVMFQDHNELIAGFNYFLPEGHEI
ncbi:hypothetical protein TSUD_46960 [Trifolium subterraneum]|nr:hypothetical protein TSUD_46960 [Trifolium subterraneum]